MVCLVFWLGNRDSNPNKQSQSLSCYRYTIPQYSQQEYYTPFLQDVKGIFIFFSIKLRNLFEGEQFDYNYPLIFLILCINIYNVLLDFEKGFRV